MRFPKNLRPWRPTYVARTLLGSASHVLAGSSQSSMNDRVTNTCSALHGTGEAGVPLSVVQIMFSDTRAWIPSHHGVLPWSWSVESRCQSLLDHFIASEKSQRNAKSGRTNGHRHHSNQRQQLYSPMPNLLIQRPVSGWTIRFCPYPPRSQVILQTPEGSEGEFAKQLVVNLAHSSARLSSPPG